MLYTEVKTWNFTNNNGLIQFHYFQPFLLYMFQRHLFPSSAWLQLAGSSTGLQMFLLNGFMYFEIKFFSAGISKLKNDVFVFFGWRFFSQIVLQKVSLLVLIIWLHFLLCCVVQKWCATADFSMSSYFTLRRCSFNLVSRFHFVFPM